MARIGSLHVMLGLDSADFTNGMKKADSGLDKFTKAAKVGFAAVAVAAAAAGAALAVAVKGSIDRADNLSKMAQRVGTTTEALSRLEWAAKLSDVSIEQLSTGMKKLSQNMLEVSQGRGAQAATAFQALGISVKDAAGNLRSSDEVLADVADRFSRMPDGAEKTALAMNLLGRAGADMIPLLNSGKDGLKDMADESDRLGNTLTTKTGKAAEAFNDSITRLQAGLQGMVNRIAEAALPTLNSLIETLTSPAFLSAMQDFAIAAIATADGIAQAFIGAHKAFKDFMEMIGASGPDARAGFGGNQQWSDMLDPDARNKLRSDIQSASIKAGGSKSSEYGSDLYAGFGLGSDGTFKVEETKSAVDQLRAAFETLGAGTAGAAAANKDLNQTMAEGLGVFEATRTPAESYAAEVERLNALLVKGAIDQDTYNRAVMQAQDAFQQAEVSGNQLASSLSTGLAGMFSSVVDGSKSAVEAIGDLLKSLGQMLIHKGFEMLIGGIFGGGMGGLFGGGGLKLGFNGIPGFAEGTNFAPGGMAIVGERGPELVNLPRGSQVIPNDQLGGGGLNVSISVDARGAQQGVGAEVARALSDFSRNELPSRMQEINRNPYRRG